MSHISVCKIKIQNPNIQLLRQTLQVIAQELSQLLGTDIQVLENAEVYDYYGRAQSCAFVIDVDLGVGNAHGIGIDVRNGELTLVTDFWALERSKLANYDIQNKIAQYYTALAVAQVAQELGFTIQNVVQQEQAIIIDLAR